MSTAVKVVQYKVHTGDESPTYLEDVDPQMVGSPS